jgi:hypothetical protein
MPNPRLIKRTVTDELFEEAPCRRPDIDNDENDTVDDDMDDAEPTGALRGKPHDNPTMGGIGAASTDDADLTGEEG